MIRATKDSAFRNKLLKEYHLDKIILFYTNPYAVSLLQEEFEESFPESFKESRENILKRMLGSGLSEELTTKIREMLARFEKGEMDDYIQKMGELCCNKFLIKKRFAYCIDFHPRGWLKD